jgi:DNA-binding protein Fis
VTRWTVVIAAPGRTWSVELSSGRSAVVGEGSANAVSITDAGLAERHVSLLPRDEGVVVEPLRGGGEVLINDVPASGQSTLQSGDELRLGEARLLFTRVPAVSPARARLTSTEELLARLDEESRRAGVHRSLGLTLVSSPGLNVAARQALVRRVVDEVQRTGVTACFGELTSEVLAVVLPELSSSALVALAARLPQVAGPRASVATARAPEDGLDGESLLGACWDQLLGAATDEPVFVDATMVRLASLAESLADDEGAVCVVGSAGSGRRTLLAQLARAAGRRVTSVSALDAPGLAKALGRAGDWLLVRDVDRLEPAALRDVQGKARSRLLATASRPVSGFAHVIEVPPLAARREDVIPLAEAFVTRARVAVGRPRLTLSAEARSMLQSWAWPGNVRELVNVMARAARAAVRDEIGRDALPARMALEAPADDFRGAMASAEREVLLEVLARTRWNVTAAATRLGMPRRTLVHRMGKLGLKRPAR